MDDRPFPIWASTVGFVVVLLLIYGVGYWLTVAFDENKRPPVHFITERDYQLFYYQNPNFPEPEGNSPDRLASLSRDTVRRYEAWVAFLKEYDPNRAIPADQFAQFLSSEPVWGPSYFDSNEYRLLVEQLPDLGADDIANRLPHDVRLAFIGWKNFEQERDQIMAFQPTYAELEALLEKAPRYGPTFWGIHLYQTQPQYLHTFRTGDYQENNLIDVSEVTPFLQLALFNFQQGKLERKTSDQ